MTTTRVFDIVVLPGGGIGVEMMNAGADLPGATETARGVAP